MEDRVAIVAAVILIAVPLRVHAQQPYDGRQPASGPSPLLSFRDQFAAANTTGDGCLTLEQAQRALPGVAKQFAQIDVKGRGCVTLVEIGSFRKEQNLKAFQKRFGAANTTHDGCLTRRQAEEGLPGVARRFSDIDVEMRGCVTLAEVTAFLQGQNAQPQASNPGQTRQQPSKPSARSQQLSFSDRFAAANTTGDGCLTRRQAEQGLPGVAKDFTQMDAEGRGCLTLDQIRMFWRDHASKHQKQPVALPKDMPPPPTGY